MAGRALLIGSQTFGLTGCDADVGLMRDLFTAQDFDVQTLTGQAATRDGIVAAAEALIAAVGQNDAALLYYSGHGGRVEHPDWAARQAAGLAAHLQFIVPWDIESSTESDFRGLLSEELSELQWRLTERTRNVTTILDCCHSGYMSRSIDLLPKAISRSFPIEGLLARLAAVPEAHHDGGRDTNPYAVRIVACQPEQSAYERNSTLAGGRHGVLTESLADIFGDAGSRDLTWSVIETLVRGRVVALAPQEPRIEGPAERVPFSLEVRKRAQSYPLGIGEGEVTIEGATLLGVRVGDTFQLVGPDGATTVATAEVTELDGDLALLELDGVDKVPDGSSAVPVKTSLPRRSVRLDVAPQTAGAFTTLLEQSPRLRVAEADEPPLATIAEDGGLVVEDSAGLRVRVGAEPDDEDGRRRTVELVELLAAADRMRTLASGEGAAALDAPVEIELVRHTDAERTPSPLNGERLFDGDRISLTIRNRSEGEVYFWLFDVGVSNRTSLLTNDAPSGARLTPAGTAGDSRTIGGGQGALLGWPDDVPRAGPGRNELFVLLFADKQQNLRPLETVTATTRALGMPSSTLDAVLDEARVGTREVLDEGAPQIRYRVERVEFFLEPRPRPRLAEPPFEIEDLPDVSLRALLPRSADTPPAKVAVRLVEMTIRKNRALFRAAVRVDALVVTRGPEGGEGIAYPTTFRFPNIGDETSLPLDNVRLYDGQVHDFLDLALWVNRDDSKGKDLAELFSGELGKPEVKTALTTLGGLAVAAPQVALAFGAVAAVATLVTVGARLVQVATGKEIGTYRTSKLAFERFGVGRTPPAGRRQAQDVEFAYEVVEIE